MIYVVSKSYAPNSAISNRMLSFARGFSELGVEACFCFFIPDQSKEKVAAEFEFVKFKYFWDQFLFPGRLLKLLSYLIYIFRFYLSLKKGDDVVFLSGYDILHYLVRKPNVNFYAEVTEAPEVYLVNSRFPTLSQGSFINTVKKLKGLFVISPSLKRYFIEKGVNDQKIEIINMIVDNKRYANIKKKSPFPYLAYCGIVSFYKDGVNDLLKAFEIVHQYDSQIKLMIIGRFADDTVKDRCYEMVQQMSLTDSVIFTGMVSSDKMPQLLLDAEILLLARPNNKQSQYGFPTKLGEYLMTANPVVLTDVGDMSQYLDNKSAIFSKPDDINDFANKIIWIMDNRNIACEIGKKGKEVAENKFNYKIETHKMISFICEKSSKDKQIYEEDRM